MRDVKLCLVQCASVTHPVLLVFVRDLEVLTGTDHGLHGGKDVLVDQPGEAPLILVCVARPVDDPHLLNKRALSTLSCA